MITAKVGQEILRQLQLVTDADTIQLFEQYLANILQISGLTGTGYVLLGMLMHRFPEGEKQHPDEPNG